MSKTPSNFPRSVQVHQETRWKGGFFFGLLMCICVAVAAKLARAQMNPYFTAISNTMPKNHLMLMLLPDYQLARVGPNYLTYMGMAEYGITNRWTAGFMIEGQKISGLANTYGGVRFNTYYQLFPHDNLLHLTLYAEYEYLDQASLYKMEVSGFGVSDLTQPLHVARNLPAHTLEQRVIAYHNWGRLNLTGNFVSEFDFENHNDYFGYVWGLFRYPKWNVMSSANDMGGKMTAPPAVSLDRVGYGVEMMGGLGDTQQFGFDWHRQQQYLGPVFSYWITRKLRLRLEPTSGLSSVSDHFVLRMGLDYSINHLFGGRRG